ncbi:POPDC3 [Cordylochernes scorpioides]|uniref:POPDC3 n=1 Tax=Cordylochernes scorpioides TaxID=51811 RepID=A0ABY6LF53_9ARAC|nr:POPDC3 [Cordylochernes scorpioides]
MEYNDSDILEYNNSIIYIGELSNSTLGYTNDTLFPAPPCSTWMSPQHALFQLANICFCLSYAAPNTRRGILFLHGLLIIGFLLFSTWAWNIICAPAIFSWNFGFMILNMGQTLYILYTMRQVKFPAELEEIYAELFEPLKRYICAVVDSSSWYMQVSRLLFKKLVGPENAQILSLHAGEAYAMRNLTKIDRLGLLLSGK